MMSLFNRIKSAYHKLEMRFILWRTKRILDSVDRKMAEHYKLQQELKKKGEEL